MRIDYEALRARLEQDYRDRILEDGWGRYRVSKDATRRYGFEVSASQARKVIDGLKDAAEPSGDGAPLQFSRPVIEVDYDAGSAQATFARPTTLDEAIDHLQINEQDWNITKAKPGTYEGQAKVKYDTGKRTEDGKPVYAERLEVTTFYKFEFQIEPRDVLTPVYELRLLELLAERAPVYIAKGPSRSSGNLMRLHIPDLHLGKPGFQAGWTVDEAEERVLQVIGEFAAMAQHHGVDRISIPLGHDFFHIDREHASRSGTLHTTGSGTPIERTVQWADLFIRGCRVGKRIVEACLQVAPVHVNIVPGNHDEQSAVALGEVLRAHFTNSSDVEINNDSLFDKFFQWGDNGFLDTHGHTKTFGELPMHFALANPELWGATRFREVNTGHKHVSKKVPVGTRTSEGGCMVYISPSLSPQDYWHRKYGFFGAPGAEAHLYHEERGPFANYERFF